MIMVFGLQVVRFPFVVSKSMLIGLSSHRVNIAHFPGSKSRLTTLQLSESLLYSFWGGTMTSANSRLDPFVKLSHKIYDNPAFYFPPSNQTDFSRRAAPAPENVAEESVAFYRPPPLSATSSRINPTPMGTRWLKSFKYLKS